MTASTNDAGELVLTANAVDTAFTVSTAINNAGVSDQEAAVGTEDGIEAVEAVKQVSYRNSS